jgi:prolyl oligopeptidase
LVGAAMTQRPELFAAALPAVGVMDMLRFHKFTIGWAWVSDYGCADHPEEFPFLLAYSPLHNLKPGVCYPATLITTADHDDRVVPGHSFKRPLWAAQAGARPTGRIQTKAGHGMGKPTAIIIQEQTDIWAFWQVLRWVPEPHYLPFRSNRKTSSIQRLLPGVELFWAGILGNAAL